MFDAQAARTGAVTVESERGYDPARRVTGRRRHALTNADCSLLLVENSPADLHNSHGGATTRLAQALAGPGPQLC